MIMITTFYVHLHTVLSYMQEDKAGALSVMHAYDNRFDIISRINSIFHFILLSTTYLIYIHRTMV